MKRLQVALCKGRTMFGITLIELGLALTNAGIGLLPEAKE